MVENSGAASIRFTPDEVSELNAAVRADCRFGVRSFDYVIERGHEDAKYKVR